MYKMSNCSKDTQDCGFDTRGVGILSGETLTGTIPTPLKGLGERGVQGPVGVNPMTPC